MERPSAPSAAAASLVSALRTSQEPDTDPAAFARKQQEITRGPPVRPHSAPVHVSRLTWLFSRSPRRLSPVW